MHALIPCLLMAALQRYTFTEVHMGTQFKIVVYAAEQAVADKAVRAAFARIKQLDGVMSDYKQDSELMRLCLKSGGPPVAVSPELFHVLERAQALARRSGGAFDVTVGPVVREWRLARKAKRLPTKEDLAEALALVGHEKMLLDPKARTVELKKAGMRLDLGGIGKGYAADEAVKVLRDHGLTRVLVAAAGRKRLDHRHRPARRPRRQTVALRAAGQQRRLDFGRRPTARRDRRQALFAHCGSANGHRQIGRAHV